MLQIEVHDRELVRFLLHQWKERWGNHVDARESIHLIIFGIEIRIRTLHLARFYIRPSHQSHAVIKEQIALGLAFAHHQAGSNHIPALHLVEFLQIYITQNIHVVDKNRL